MKNYQDYKIEDFASDDRFINWCLQPNEQSNEFWNNWIKSHPEQKATILDAKQLVLNLQQLETEEDDMNLEQEIWENIEANISTQNERPKIIRLRNVLSIAATLLVLVSAFIWIKNQSSSPSKTKLADAEWINYENTTGLIKTIVLADSSSVTLEPFSSLKYPTTFNGEERAVFLKGEAFFDIARDTLKPFMVYANETITKVLGTSFRVIAFEGEKTVEVEVKTGKVAVYANVASEKNTGVKKQMIVEADEKISLPLPNKKIEVTPNQKVVFDRKAENMIRTVAPLPQIIKKVEELPQFQFKNEPIAKIFTALEEAYGIDLEFDEATLSNCTVTTTLNDEPLFQKLNIICMALNLEYSEKDAVIFIKGEGC